LACFLLADPRGASTSGAQPLRRQLYPVVGSRPPGV